MKQLTEDQFIDYILEHYVEITESVDLVIDVEALWDLYILNSPEDIIEFAKECNELFIELEL